jgi:hypothetical protein
MIEDQEDIQHLEAQCGDGEEVNRPGAVKMISREW